MDFFFLKPTRFLVMTAPHSRMFSVGARKNSDSCVKYVQDPVLGPPPMAKFRCFCGIF